MGRSIFAAIGRTKMTCNQGRDVEVTTVSKCSKVGTAVVRAEGSHRGGEIAPRLAIKKPV